MLRPCETCGGFLPSTDGASCPHCDAPAAVSALRGTPLQRAGLTGAILAASVTLMACYGGGWDPPAGYEVYCDDAYDDDQDGLVDCDDPDCSEAFECEDPCLNTNCVSEETVCDDGADNDSDGLIDCEDDDCGCEVVEFACADGIDGDFDGLTDCDDPDCEPVCITEVDCTDDIDNDADGLIDCADSDCAAACSQELDCSDDTDNDNDGLIDCADSDCVAACTECGDGLISGQEECDDGATVDGDGCSASCTLEEVIFCANLPVLQPGANTGDTQLGTRAFAGSCIDQNNVGPEQSFSFVAPSNGTLYLTLDPASDLGLRATLGCGTAATELGCSNQLGSGAPENLELLLPSGTTITVDVLSSGWTADDTYTLLATFVPEE